MRFLLQPHLYCRRPTCPNRDSYPEFEAYLKKWKRNPLGGDEGQAAAGPPTPAVAAGPSGSGVAAVAAHRAQVARGKQPVSAGRSGDTASNTAVQDIARRALKEAQKVVDARKKVTTDLDAEIAVRDLEVARLRVTRGLAGDSLAESEAIRDEKAAEVRQLGASSSKRAPK
eukprot:jgi/Astpho2/7272/fgenesh1_pg.00113_%23_78_t